MSNLNEAEDYKILSFETDAKIPEEIDVNNNIIKFDDNNKIVEHKATIKEVGYSFFKRAVDVVASGAALILLSPVFLATTIAIKKDDKGPAIFTQERIGKDGKLFKLYKFRSMKQDADKILFDMLENDKDIAEEYRINKKLKDDPRVTKVGKFIRRTSIDELPQLLNVFKGEMSLVGPRPYLPREMDDMGDYYDTIIESKPGITGLWQVSGRSNTTFDERLVFDEQYNEEKGFFYDMGLLFKTVGTVIGKDGAK